MKRWAELIGAASLLTRLPVGGWVAEHPPAADCVWAYPVIGVLTGGIGAGVLWIGTAAGLSQPLAAIWALAVIALVTGALHEDGLADTLDGFGGGRTAERKLAIMRDSRIGSFGALGLVFSAALRIVPLASTAHPCWAILLVNVLARGAMLVPLILLRPARTDGLAASLQTGARRYALAGVVIAAVAALWAPGAGLAIAAVGLLMSMLSYRQIGGYTGDSLGAVEQIAECAALSLM